MCVDRLSGWIIARPCTKLGLTAERAAHLVMENGWETFGVPSVITSDQGSQFVGQWWRTMCARLGIRQAYSQAYRPQANGRAEVAGKALIDILRKLSAEENLNLAEALPRVLKLYHDAPGASGLSPFQIIFGRDRNLAGAPYSEERECEGAKVFFDRMEDLDKKVAKCLNEEHKKIVERINAKLTKPQPYQVGDWVWVLRPKGGKLSKLDTWWVGPAQVVRRTGELSYQVRVKPDVVRDVHMDQLKSFHGDKLEGSCVHLYHHQTGYQPMAIATDEWDVDKILGHKVGKDGKLLFLTRWAGSDEETWEPARNFVARYCYELVKYLQDKGLECDMGKVLSGVPTV